MLLWRPAGAELAIPCQKLLPFRELGALLPAPMPQGQRKTPEAEDRTPRWLSSEPPSGKASPWCT